MDYCVRIVMHLQIYLGFSASRTIMCSHMQAAGHTKIGVRSPGKMLQSDDPAELLRLPVKSICITMDKYSRWIKRGFHMRGV